MRRLICLFRGHQTVTTNPDAKLYYVSRCRRCGSILEVRNVR